MTTVGEVTFLLLTFLPVWLRRASQDEVEQPRADAGEAGCRSVFRQARDGLSKNPTSVEKRRVPINRVSD